MAGIFKASAKVFGAIIGLGTRRAANTGAAWDDFGYVDVFTNPQATGDTGCLGATALPSSGTTTVTTGITQPTHPRNVRVIASAAATSTVTVNGVDQFGASISEELTLNGTNSVAGTKVFASITSIVLATRIDGAANVTAGYGAVIGTSRRIHGVSIDGGVYTTASGKLTAVQETTRPVKSTAAGVHGVTFNTALAATKTYVLRYRSDEAR